VSVLRRHGGEIATVAATSVAALAILWLADTQIYTEPWTIDPWLYTALMTNFDTIYGWFTTTYYASRLPAILPGLFLNSFLTPQQAYVVLHLTTFLAGGAFLYLLVRWLFDIRVALFVYPAVLTNAAYVDAHTWDYVDGFVITYLAAGMYFLVSSIGGRSRVRPALAGFFLAAAAASNLFAVLLIAGALAAYLYGRRRIERRFAIASLGVDAALFAAGAGVLLAGCGAFAREHGGRTLFFMPSIDAARTISTATYKLPSYEWVWGEPRLLIPPLVAAAALLAWPYRRRSGHDAVALGLVAVAIGIFAVLVFWELARSGTFLQLQYYFDMLYPFLFVALAAAVFALSGPSKREHPLPPAAIAGLGLAVGAAPLIAVYVFERGHLWGRRGAVVTVVLLSLVLLAAAGLRVARTRQRALALAPFAAVLLVAGVNYASAASTTTHTDFETSGSSLADADDVFAIGVQLMDFMQRNGLEGSPPPAFWFDESADPALTGLQSLYYYSYTFLSREMPNIDDGFRTLVESRGPRQIVLLCTEPTCSGGARAMRRAGYQIEPLAATKLSSGAKSIWVRAYAFG
jgi:hypothetical protein